MFSCFSCTNEKKTDLSSKEVDIDLLVNRYLELGRFSGAILVARKDSILFYKTYGRADYELDKAFEKNTSFKIGEISEYITGAIIREMANRKQVALKEKASAYIPELTGDYTLNDLLNHQSGLPGIQSIKALNKEMRYSIIDYANKANIDLENRGVKSDLGYNILGLVIETVSGMTFQEVIKQYSADWQLENTYFEKENLNLEAKGYQYHNYRGKGLELEQSPTYNEAEAYSSRGLKSTTHDLLRLTQIVSQENIKIEAYLPNDGFSYSLNKKESNALTIIILSNRRHPVADEISNSINNIFENKAYETPLPRKQVEIAPELLLDYAGSYQLNPNMTLPIISKNDSLFVMMGPNPIHLKAQSDNQFYMEESDAIIRFMRDSANVVDRAILLDGFLEGNEIRKIRSK